MPVHRAIVMLGMAGLALVGCSESASSDAAMQVDAATVDAGPPSMAEDAGHESPPARILAAYHGLDELPAMVAFLCDASAIGQDGLPVTFSVQLDDATLAPEAFVVETASGEVVVPVCATLAPATEPLERRTVLLAGAFGTAGATPRSVRVVGALRDRAGRSLEGLSTTTIAPLSAGPRLVLAERFAATTPGLEGECPASTQQVVQLAWEGGVTGPGGAALGEPQRMAIVVALEDGRSVTPIALADDDPDNFVLACLDDATPARSVAARAGVFHDPGDDPNPATEVEVSGAEP